MFKLALSPSFSWPVVVLVAADGGRHDKHTFDVEFRRKSQAELLEVRQRIEAGSLSDADFVREIVVGWKGVADEEGSPLPFSASALDRVLDVPNLAGSVVLAYLDACSGLARKN